MLLITLLNPIRLIKNFFLARSLCKRYKLYYDPFCWKLDQGTIHSDLSILLNPFSPHFKSILFHEIGHAVHHKIVNYDDFFKSTSDSWLKRTKDDKLQDFEKVLIAEKFASRFAIKTKKVDNEYLIRCFNTYTAMFFYDSQHIEHSHLMSDYIKIIHKHYLSLRFF